MQQEFRLQSNDSAPATMQSEKQRRYLKELVALMSQVRSNFAAQELTSETSMMWLDAWHELAEKHGIVLLRAALMHHCRTQRFLPLPVDVMDAIEAVKQQRIAATNTAHPFVPCSRCVDGWLIEEIVHDGKPRSQARECQCKKQWRATRPAKTA